MFIFSSIFDFYQKNKLFYLIVFLNYKSILIFILKFLFIKIKILEIKIFKLNLKR